MAAVTSLAIGAAVSGYSIYQGEKQKKEAKKALNNLDQQALENVYQDLPISTVGSDVLKEQNSRTTSQLVGASRNAGIRGVLSEVPKIQSFSNDANREGQAYLDNQVQDRNRLIASDNQRIQGMEEQRYNAELAGIGQLMEVGQAYTDQGIRGLGNTLMSGAKNIDFSNTEYSHIEQVQIKETFDNILRTVLLEKENLLQIYAKELQQYQPDFSEKPSFIATSRR